MVFLVGALPFVFELIPPEVKEMGILDLIGYIAPILKTITVGAILVGVLNFLKVKVGIRV